MDPAEALTTRLAGALADLGLRHAVISPGSRSTPLALAFAAEPRITSRVLLDERSAGFFALGIAKQSGTPAALVCTSGTAATNYLPAVVEASHARIPLLVLTADRPPELRGTAAPQTIDQIDLYGSAVRLFHDVGVPGEAIAAAAPSLALRAWSTALDAPQGPVHLNFPFREPLASPAEAAGPMTLQHHRGEVQLPPEDLVELGERLSGRRALIVAGGRQRPGFAAASAMFAGESLIPIVADIQCRFPSPSTIVNSDLLAATGFFHKHEPEIIVRVGPIPTSRPIWSWLEGTSAEQITLDDAGWRDPLNTATTAYRADPAVTFADLSGRVKPTPDSWIAAWQAADHTVGLTVDRALEIEVFPNEPAIARAVWESTPAGATIFAASSMPIRDLDSFSGSARGEIAVLSNRGANGIDGLLSAAAGASASDGRRVVALAGDLSVLHDATALGVIARFDLPVTIIAVNNDGGGIFHFLSQADRLDPDRFEMLFGTPHGQSLTAVANAFGIPAREVTDGDDLRSAVAEPNGPSLLEIKTERAANRDVHERLRAAAKEALSSEL
ncbi:MAG: 2-succinyl-5-enolpyruvyl-6-hydroxy-3-cyclohexene-1-carboxylic-acid synthase [Actinomycetota bacterium]|nr:2-succinyl-5-enolpyruvyl-6-hydroxy-3-cyclohexene-1-carboxylic-acid synthase [Actinomycetota bacterium]